MYARAIVILSMSHAETRNSERMCMGRVLLRFSLTDFVFIVYYIRPSLSKLNIYTFR